MKTVNPKKLDKSAIDKVNEIPEELNLDGLPDSQVITPKEDEAPPVDPEGAPDDDPQDQTENPDDLENEEEDSAPSNNEPGTFDWQKKFAESSREAQILSSKNRKLTETIEEAATLPAPSDEEMKNEYADWDSLTEFEQKIARNQLHDKKKFDKIHEAVQATKQVDEWAKKVDEFVTAPANLQKYQELDGREAEFRSFSMKESRRGVDFEDLVAAFLFQAESQPKKPKQKGSLLARPSGGQAPAKPQGLTLEQIAYIRKTDSRKYKQLVKEGKIKINV